ncbi:MAG: hypothetical protein FWD61_03440 [Phycisphaerales bacterium]|nr:hypothetical protein [Phycisphaerales bacterium]
MTMTLPESATTYATDEEVANGVKLQVRRLLCAAGIKAKVDAYLFTYCTSFFGYPVKTYSISVRVAGRSDAIATYNALLGAKVVHMPYLELGAATLNYAGDFQHDDGVEIMFVARFFVGAEGGVATIK